MSMFKFIEVKNSKGQKQKLDANRINCYCSGVDGADVDKNEFTVITVEGSENPWVSQESFDDFDEKVKNIGLAKKFIYKMNEDMGQTKVDISKITGYSSVSDGRATAIKVYGADDWCCFDEPVESFEERLRKLEEEK